MNLTSSSLEIHGLNETDFTDVLYKLTEETCKIEEFICRSPNITPSMALSVKEMIQNNLSLIRVDISLSKTFGEHIKGIIKQLTVHPKISEISLTNISIPKDTSHYLKNMLNSNKNIKILNLSSNSSIDSSFLQELSNVENSSLQSLTLSSCSLNDESIPYIVKLIENNENINFIDLYSNKLSDKGINKLIQESSRWNKREVVINTNNQKKGFFPSLFN